MQVLVLGLGSAGDVHPMVALSLALRARSHNIVLAANGIFRPLADRHRLEFFELGSEQAYREAVNDPDLWHPKRAFNVVNRRMILPLMRPVYEWIASSYRHGETVVAAPGTALGARIANEKLGVPLATVHLQPAILRSVYQSPAVAMPDVLGKLPRPLKRLFYRIVDRFVIDRVLRKETNELRAELDLRPLRRYFNGWIHSPELVLGFFPDWFGPLQPDWPPNTHLVGFPLYDESDSRTAPPELEQFLRAGTPPVVFTAGSAMAQGRKFFKVSVEASQKLNLRAILLTQFPEQLPNPLPRGAQHFSYVPFSQVLPRAAAFVHHGGIGTTAQAFAAGVPQLVVPYAHDQPDNALRVQRLGTGLALLPQAYTTPRVTESLKRLLELTQIKAKCRRFEQLTKNNSITEACGLIEQLGSTAVRAASL